MAKYATTPLMVKTGDIVRLRVTHLAGLGDGVAELGGIPVFVPFTCAGDEVEARIMQVNRESCRAEPIKIIEHSANKQEPPCPHFGTCGGCALQHLLPETYGEFKRGIALRAVEQLGVDRRVVQPLFESGPESRRRAEVKIAVANGEVRLGFMAARSHEVVDTPGCRVVEPAILQAMAAWKALLQAMKKPSVFKSIHFTAADNGLDVHLRMEGKAKPADMEMLRGFAASQPVVRLLMDGQTLKAGEPQVNMGGMAVTLPPESFLQATQASQRRMVELVLKHCAGHRVVADLYCGCGTFSLPLAQAGHTVRAYEGGQEAVTVLFNAVRRGGLDVTAQVRDLYAQPLTVELQGVEAVVINPPRNGALPQCKALGQSGVKKIVMVSCNPATFVRDAQTLQTGGFRLVELTPVDQFTWSHHLELVGVFVRESAQ